MISQTIWKGRKEFTCFLRSKRQVMKLFKQEVVRGADVPQKWSRGVLVSGEHVHKLVGELRQSRRLYQTHRTTARSDSVVKKSQDGMETGFR